MAWTTPRTYVAGEIVTASILNVDVRDNLNALKEKHREIIAQRAAAQAIVNQAWQYLTLDTEITDDWNGFNPPNVFVALPSTRSLVFAQVDFNGQTGAVNAAIRIVRSNSGGVAQQYYGWLGPVTIGVGTTVGKLSTAAFVYSATGDVVHVELYLEATGSAGNITLGMLNVLDYGFA